MRYCLFLVAVLAAAQSTELRVDTLVLQEGQEVKFSPLRVGTGEPTAAKVVGQSEHFRVLLDESGPVYEPDFRWFKYGVFLQPVNDPHRADRWELKAIPRGPFLDQVADLHFHVTASGIAESGDLRLPVHSLAGQDFLEWKPEWPSESKVFEVHIGRDELLPIAVHNVLPDMAVTIRGITATYGNPILWSGQPAVETAPAGSVLTVGEGGKVTISHITVRANPWQAVAATFIPKKDKPQDQVHVHILYATQTGGRERPLDFDLPIHFVPNPVLFLAALLVGSCIGVILRRGLDKNREALAPWWKLWLLAVLATIVVDGVTLVMISCGSKFVLFTFEIDPLQILQVFVLATLIAWYGPDRLDLLNKLVKTP
jgi:hypothetical protein